MKNINLIKKWTSTFKSMEIMPSKHIKSHSECPKAYKKITPHLLNKTCICCPKSPSPKSHSKPKKVNHKPGLITVSPFGMSQRWMMIAGRRQHHLSRGVGNLAHQQRICFRR